METILNIFIGMVGTVIVLALVCLVVYIVQEMYAGRKEMVRENKQYLRNLFKKGE